MPTPAISIILPTYNGSRYLRTSLDSCLAQGFTDFELIIVNDCSTDDTRPIAEEYTARDPRVRLINNESNKKLPLSLNTGFEQATGRYFTWTSDDNAYGPNALQVMYDAITRNKSIDLVYTDYTLIDEEGKTFGNRVFGDVNKSFVNWLGAGACFLYKREIHQENRGYNASAFLIEDYDFFVRAFLKFQCHYIPRTDLYFYRDHPAALTATQNTAINDISKLFLERNLPGLEKKLPAEERILLYRKMAVYYAVTKNHAGKYRHYLKLMASISKKQVFVTTLYVFARKIGYALSIGFAGIGQALRLLTK